MQLLVVGWLVILTQLLVGWLAILMHLIIVGWSVILTQSLLAGDLHMLNSILGLVDDPQDSLALSRSFKTPQVDLFVSVCFVVPYFLVGKPRRGIG